MGGGSRRERGRWRPSGAAWRGPRVVRRVFGVSVPRWWAGRLVHSWLAGRGACRSACMHACLACCSAPSAVLRARCCSGGARRSWQGGSLDAGSRCWGHALACTRASVCVRGRQIVVRCCGWQLLHAPGLRNICLGASSRGARASVFSCVGAANACHNHCPGTPSYGGVGVGNRTACARVLRVATQAKLRTIICVVLCACSRAIARACCVVPQSRLCAPGSLPHHAVTGLQHQASHSASLVI